MAITWNNTPVVDSIQLPGSQTKYWVKDTEARQKIEDLVSATHFLGVTTTALTDESTTNPIVINGKNVTAVSGDITIYKQTDHVPLEFIFDGTHWQLLGGQAIEGAGALAYKDSAEGGYTPTGSVTLSMTNERAGDIDVVTNVTQDFYIDITNTDDSRTGAGTPVLTDVSASNLKVVTEILTKSSVAGSKTDDGSLPTLTSVIASGLTATISNTTLVFATDGNVSISYSFNSGVFPKYSFASVIKDIMVTTSYVVSEVTGVSTDIYAAFNGNLGVTYSGITGTFDGSSTTITVS